jgi:hypothetical protein
MAAVPDAVLRIMIKKMMQLTYVISMMKRRGYALHDIISKAKQNSQLFISGD